MAKDFIVAIELGSSKITGVAGKKNPDGSISILAVAKEDSASYIRKGVVYKIDRTAQGLSNILTKLKNTLQTDIAQVYVGIGGQSIRSVKNLIIKDLPSDTIVSQEMVNELMDANRNMVYPDYEIQDAITEEYKVDALYQSDPVGIQALHLEGNFLNILWRRSFYRNLNKSLDNAGITVAEMYLAPLVMADNVLAEAEKRAGCVLVDLGAETTTIQVYYRDKLRSIAVLPLGSANVTKDLESLQLDEKEAEEMKTKYASAVTDVENIDPQETLAIDSTRSLSKLQFIEVVEARMLEIIENVKNLIPTEYADKLPGGVILTGGGSNMQNIDRAFREVLGCEKVRVAKTVTLNINTRESACKLPADGTMNTVLSILAKGNMNCAGREFSDNLFDEEHFSETPVPQSPEAVANEALRRQQQQLEEERLRREAEAKRLSEQRTPEPEPKPEEPKRESSFSRFFGSLKKFGRSLVEPDTNE